MSRRSGNISRKRSRRRQCGNCAVHYDAGHIPGAICVPNESIGEKRPEALPDPDQLLLIYCRSGRRSKEASQKLYDMGYTNVYEFGGIIDWTGDVVRSSDAS